VVGVATRGPPLKNFLWRAGNFTDLASCHPVDVNNRGQVLCAPSTIGGPGPVIWDAGSAMQRDTLSQTPYAINDSGWVAMQGDSYVLRWRAPGRVDTLDRKRGYMSGINNTGDAVGTQTGEVLYSQGYVWSAGQHRISGYGRYVVLLGINDSSDVVGRSEAMSVNGQVNVAILARRSNAWTVEELRSSRPVLNDVAIEAKDVNNQRQIVGYGSQGPFVWTNGNVTLLNQVLADPAWTILVVNRINNRGQILGVGIYSITGRLGVVVIDPP
jgi:hypothetical protein